MFQDKNIDYARQRHIIEVSDMNSINHNGNGLYTVSTHYPALQEINGLGFWGILFDNDGETAVHSFKAPDHWDYNRPIGVQLEWSSPSTTAADDVLWVAYVKAISVGDEIEIPDTTDDVLDTALASQTIGSTTDFLLRETSRGIINPGRIVRGDRIMVRVARHANTDANLNLHSVIFDYMPKITRGPGVRNDRPYEPEQVDHKY